MKKHLFALVIPLILAGCGGGSSSSGGGGAYAGTYNGTIFMRGIGPGGSVTQNAPMVIVINPSGTVRAAIPVANQSGATCGQSTAGPTVMEGNSFRAEDNLVCSLPGVGVCPTSANISGSVNENSLTGSGAFIYNCPPGQAVIEFTFNTTKTTGFAKAPITKPLAEATAEAGAQ